MKTDNERKDHAADWIKVRRWLQNPVAGDGGWQAFKQLEAAGEIDKLQTALKSGEMDHLFPKQ